jgi:hypothetical protein
VSPEFCTLFDSKYLPRGLALHESLRRVEPDAHLRVFCMDDRAYGVLQALQLPGLTAVSLNELERHDPQLAAVKSDRTPVEYLWTATPSIARYCLTHEPDLDAITYLDADVFFFSSPQPLFDELGDDSTQIVPHRYAAENRHQEETSGIYNVEWLTFKRDARALETLNWWRERCLEWCYNRLEDGKLGDQKYLDDWPTRFDGVSVLQHIGGGLAPWNVVNYTVHERDGRLWVDDEPVVFYHFHSLQLLECSPRSVRGRLLTGLRAASAGSLLWASRYPRSSVEERLVWEPYLAAIVRALELARTVDPGFSEGFVTSWELARHSLRNQLGLAYRRASRVQARLRPRRAPV